ncbi:peptide-binding protein [Frateuria sp. Soil773]|uniref:type VI secretion system-associated FHA domain protein TagH n=1 Tax=Frateuria sp. Soil773 TaxID=1736407 RepID=UPI0006F6BB43|nr:type VI secretion system-associated FHA domain protein TagH [Frateuria sp. Soil773]KRE88297.1 peptide-binding protein [Frateuria sp. Soil773]
MSTPQTLILAVLGPQAAQFGSRSERAFEGRDGSIGRSEDCDWVLSAAGVSRVHAMIRFLNGIYFIEDRSTNGMLHNGAPLAKGEPSVLKDGDRLQIDTFEVAVRLRSAAAPAPAIAPAPAPSAMGGDPLDFGLPDLAPRGGAPFDDGLVHGGLIRDGLAHDGSNPDGLISDARLRPAGGELDPLSFLDAPFAPAEALAAAPAPSWNHSAASADHFRPPMTAERRQAQALPENWDLTMGDFAPKAPPAKAPAPVPVAAPAPAQAEAPARGHLPPELDQIFRIVVDGVMDVLRARAEIKNTFRLPVTIIQRSENNPLKFAATTDEAVQKIMAPPNAAFLSGTAAFDDAFDDIRCHQMAMLAGVRAAFESLLAHFNPDRFEHEADGAKRSAFAGKGRYWEKYRENFDGLARNPDECFRRLFGDEFARAYEEQLARLKSARRAQSLR